MSDSTSNRPIHLHIASSETTSTFQYPNGHLIYRHLQKNFPLITHGKGSFLYDKDGKDYLDATGGAYVATLGHGHPEIAQTITEQLSKVAYINGTQFVSESSLNLAEKLFTHAKSLNGNYRSYFLSSGSEAVEAAIKFCRQVQVERGEEKRFKVITRTPCYHGNTLFALSVSARPSYQKMYGPYIQPSYSIKAPYAYRSDVLPYDEKAAEHYANLLEEKIKQEGPQTISAFLFEPIIGSSMGGALPPEGYFKKIQSICQKYRILMIADEVLCGSGRSGKFFASSWFDISPDVITLGKGLNAGFSPLSALIAKEEHVALIAKKSGYFHHAQTYTNAPCSTIAGCVTLDYLEKNNLIEKCRENGMKLHERLHKEIFNHLKFSQYIGHIDGKGLLAGIELVEDKKTKKPFDRKKMIAEKIVAKALENGLNLWPNIGHIDGVNGDLILLAPPFTITDSEMDVLFDRLQQTFLEVFKTET